MFFGEEVEVRLADCILRIAQAEGVGVGLADHDETPVGILEVHVIRGVVHERLEKGPFLDQSLFCPPTLCHLADEEHERHRCPVRTPNEFAGRLYRDSGAVLA